MIASGKVKGREFKKNRDSDTVKTVLQVEITDPEDVQSVELMGHTGEMTNPPNGSRVIIIDVGSANRVAIASDDGIVPTMGAGEKKLYSTSAGAIVAFINLLSTGVIEINGSGDFAVSFNELKTAFDQLKSDFDAHIHPGVTVGAGATGAIAVGSTADIDPAKVATVKLP